MKVCTFFGHRNCPDSVKPKLRETLIRLIETKQVTLFYVGNHGSFDAMVRSVLRELIIQYPYIDYAVVLAYMPSEQKESDPLDSYETMLPEGIETVPKRFAISWRNKWMLTQADYVVTYITHSWGGAAQFAEIAKRKKKAILPLG